MEPFNLEEQNISLFYGRHYGLFIPVEQNLYNGLPEQRVYQNLLIYNKQLLEANGIPDISELQQRKEWTWDKFLEITERLTTDRDGDGLTDIWGFGFDSETFLLSNFLHSNNAYIVDDTRADKAIVDLTNPKVEETLKFLNTIIYSRQLTYMPGNDSITMSLSADTMMQNNKVGIVSTNHAKSNTNNVVFYPIGPSADNYTCTLSKYDYYFIPVTANNPEEIAIILKELYYFADSTRKAWAENNKPSDEFADNNEKFIF